MEQENTKYNCFKCDGVRGDCDGSYVFPSDTTCIWKQMAERDLEVYRKGENDLVLPEMLCDRFSSDLVPLDFSASAGRSADGPWLEGPYAAGLLEHIYNRDLDFS